MKLKFPSQCNFSGSSSAATRPNRTTACRNNTNAISPPLVTRLTVGRNATANWVCLGNGVREFSLCPFLFSVFFLLRTLYPLRFSDLGNDFGIHEQANINRHP